MIDIILVNGVNYQTNEAIPQIGQLILREILRKEFEVECINFDYLVKKDQMKYLPTLDENIEQFAVYICQFKPKIVGLYTICNSFMTSLLLAKHIKDLMPQTIIVFGGPHATLLAKECLCEYPFVNVISLGESEKTIFPLMKALMTHQDLSKLQGVAFVQHDEVIYNASPALLTNDELGQYTPMDYKPFELSREGKIELEAGRGCPFECTFCSTSTFWGRKFRIKPVDSLIQEMMKLNKLYGIKTFSFVHD
ncbi:MAG: cobalamin-dependent protein, partial [Lachnospiraceae bacterium]|nr:cobalamin-dependent protein [Lachnospiraceae bacterium]